MFHHHFSAWFLIPYLLPQIPWVPSEMSLYLRAANACHFKCEGDSRLAPETTFSNTEQNYIMLRMAFLKDIEQVLLTITLLSIYFNILKSFMCLFSPRWIAVLSLYLFITTMMQRQTDFNCTYQNMSHFLLIDDLKQVHVVIPFIVLPHFTSLHIECNH